MKRSKVLEPKRGATLLLLLAALLVRAAIPQGYMAETDERGRISITVCHSDIVWRIPLLKKMAAHAGHHGQGEHSQQDEHSGHGEPQPCAFAAMALGTPPADALALPLPATVAERFAENETPFAFAATARQLPPARAPPAIA